MTLEVINKKDWGLVEQYKFTLLPTLKSVTGYCLVLRYRFL